MLSPVKSTYLNNNVHCVALRIVSRASALRERNGPHNTERVTCSRVQIHRTHGGTGNINIVTPYAKYASRLMLLWCSPAFCSGDSHSRVRGRSHNSRGIFLRIYPVRHRITSAMVYVRLYVCVLAIYWATHCPYFPLVKSNWKTVARAFLVDIELAPRPLRKGFARFSRPFFISIPFFTTSVSKNIDFATVVFPPPYYEAQAARGSFSA